MDGRGDDENLVVVINMFGIVHDSGDRDLTKFHDDCDPARLHAMFSMADMLFL
jgi:hypothetical protein